MFTRIVKGTFFGGEIEPGTFHGSFRVDPRGDDPVPSSGESDETDSQTPAECEDA